MILLFLGKALHVALAKADDGRCEKVSEDQKKVEEKTSCVTKIETKDKGNMEIMSDPIPTRNPLMLVQRQAVIDINK